MPIGKNALKRVSNNGYSNVTATAPDMENSEIVEVQAPVTEVKPEPKKVGRPAKKAEEETAPKRKPGRPAKKAEEKTEPKKVGRPPKKVAEETAPKRKPGRPPKSPEEKAASAKAAPKKNNTPKVNKPKVEAPEIKTVEETSHPDGFVKISCGMDMPAYLL